MAERPNRPDMEAIRAERKVGQASQHAQSLSFKKEDILAGSKELENKLNEIDKLKSKIGNKGFATDKDLNLYEKLTKQAEDYTKSITRQVNVAKTKASLWTTEIANMKIVDRLSTDYNDQLSEQVINIREVIKALDGVGQSITENNDKSARGNQLDLKALMDKATVHKRLQNDIQLMQRGGGAVAGSLLSQIFTSDMSRRTIAGMSSSMGAGVRHTMEEEEDTGAKGFINSLKSGNVWRMIGSALMAGVAKVAGKALEVALEGPGYTGDLLRSSTNLGRRYNLLNRSGSGLLRDTGFGATLSNQESLGMIENYGQYGGGLSSNRAIQMGRFSRGFGVDVGTTGGIAGSAAGSLGINSRESSNFLDMVSGGLEKGFKAIDMPMILQNLGAAVSELNGVLPNLTEDTQAQIVGMTATLNKLDVSLPAQPRLISEALRSVMQPKTPLSATIGMMATGVLGGKAEQIAAIQKYGGAEKKNLMESFKSSNFDQFTFMNMIAPVLMEQGAAQIFKDKRGVAGKLFGGMASNIEFSQMLEGSASDKFKQLFLKEYQAIEEKPGITEGVYKTYTGTEAHTAAMKKVVEESVKITTGMAAWGLATEAIKGMAISADSAKEVFNAISKIAVPAIPGMSTDPHKAAIDLKTAKSPIKPVQGTIGWLQRNIPGVNW